MRVLQVLFFLTVFLVSAPSLEAQFWKKLKKRAEQAAEETIQRKVEEKTAEETEKAMDSILEAPGKKIRKKKKKSKQSSTDAEGEYEETMEEEMDYGAIEVYSKFDFVPGDQVIFFDDFSNDYAGDFPSKWNTNGSGEIVTIGDSSEKWFEMKSGYGIVHMPNVPKLTDEFTVEFDLLAIGLDKQTGSTAVLKVGVSDDPSFKWGNFANIDIPFCQYHPVGFFARNGGTINNKVDGDIRDKVLNQVHVSIAVNKQRFRLWVDEGKYIDIPKMIPANVSPSNIKFEIRQFKNGKERLFIKNFKVAEGGQDLRRKLTQEGAISTNGILFESGSAKLQPQSMGIIRQISQVLNQEDDMDLLIVGHTDADGDDTLNLELSKKRANTVKTTLVAVYGIDSERLQTEGKGEAEPVSDNSTADGKAQNRRVEFIRL